MLKKVSAIFLVFFALFFVVVAVRADDNKCDPSRFSDPEDPVLAQCIADFNKNLQLSINATKPLAGQLESLQRQLAQIQATIDNLVAGITQKQKDLDIREDKLALQQALLEQRVKAYYIRSYLTDPLLVILSSIRAGDLFRELSYRQSVAKEDRQIISSITSEVINLLTEKDKLEKDKARLAVIQADVDKNATFLGGEIKKAKAYQADLGKQIASLSAKQQELLAAKLGSLNLPRSAYAMRGGCTDDRQLDPGFSPRFAMFTYGVPNRVGLSQFGAWGRAKNGQGEDQILHAYYNFDGYQNADTNINIRVNDSNGFNSGNIIWSGSLEDYVKRIYEVPDSWADNGLAALKAQAIAARSYVLAATNNGASSICANEYCQAFQTNPKGGNWESAVNATPGKIMVQGGQPVKAWFSSTHGGYVFSSGDIGWSSTPWTKRAVDTAGGIGSFFDLQNNAYDKISPVFYCDWGSRAQYNKTAWLKPEELADIVNSILLVQADSSADPHILQTDRGYPETWNEDKVRQELSKYRKPFGSISSGRVDADFGSGRTTRVYFSGDGGSVDFPADAFKKYFNLRAPSNINIVGPLYNIEQK